MCELWNASTKHPDSKFYFSDFKKSLTTMTKEELEKLTSADYQELAAKGIYDAVINKKR